MRNQMDREMDTGYTGSYRDYHVEMGRGRLSILQFFLVPV